MNNISFIAGRIAAPIGYAARATGHAAKATFNVFKSLFSKIATSAVVTKAVLFLKNLPTPVKMALVIPAVTVGGVLITIGIGMVIYKAFKASIAPKAEASESLNSNEGNGNGVSSNEYQQPRAPSLKPEDAKKVPQAHNNQQPNAPSAPVSETDNNGGQVPQNNGGNAGNQTGVNGSTKPVSPSGTQSGDDQQPMSALIGAGATNTLVVEPEVQVTRL